MKWKNDAHHYGSLPIALHWLTLLLLFGIYAAIELHDLAPKGSALRADLKLWHFALGLTLFALVAMRLAVRRAWGSAPAIEPAPPRWELRAAHLLHGALYAFLVAMPLLGWLAVSAAGKPVALAGIELPALMGAAPELSKSLKSIHETLGELGYWLIGLHAIAALMHHYWRHDDTLTRMLPRRLASHAGLPAERRAPDADFHEHAR
ncbi:MAG: cytochrome b [Burkholderiaceae bacterium]|nr:cytochrome b [Burkholderiaceae bacterium]